MKTSAIILQTSYISYYIKHHPLSIKHINNCEELVKILVHRCKKLDGAE